MSIIETTFASIAQADAINTAAPWTGANSGTKQTALEWATVYMLDIYNVSIVDVADCLVTANSMLANSHLTTDLFQAAKVGKNPIGLTQKTVKAEVESSKSFDPLMANRWEDPFPSITALLKANGFNLRNGSGSMKTVPLMRR